MSAPTWEQFGIRWTVLNWPEEEETIPSSGRINWKLSGTLRRLAGSNGALSPRGAEPVVRDTPPQPKEHSKCQPF